MQGPARGDAPDKAVKQETDLLSFWARQEENTSPWKKDVKRHIQYVYDKWLKNDDKRWEKLTNTKSIKNQ